MPHQGVAAAMVTYRLSYCIEIALGAVLVINCLLRAIKNQKVYAKRKSV